MKKKIEGIEVLKLRRTQDLLTDENPRIKTRVVKMKKKSGIPRNIRKQLLRNYGFFVEDN